MLEWMNEWMNEWIIIRANSAVLNHFIIFLMPLCSIPLLLPESDWPTDRLTEGLMEILMKHREIDRLDDRSTNSDVTGGEKAHFSCILRDCFRLYNGLLPFQLPVHSQHTKKWMKEFLHEIMNKFVNKFVSEFIYHKRMLSPCRKSCKVLMTMKAAKLDLARCGAV